ncbi:MAG: PIG-L family deacetylase [Solobacterium sp.]|nr:PIG-L family deacetylase [Solobacterium sp.]
MSLTSIILRHAVPVPKIENFDRFLFIGPHPDDIEIGAGATIAKLRRMGKEVTFLICMDGRYGLEHAPKGTTPEELTAIRKEETLAGAKVLGVSDVRFLDLCDGGFYDTDELYQGILRVIGEVQPEILFAPDPSPLNECHIDHLNAGNAAKRAAFFAPFKEVMERYGARNAPVKAIAFYMTAKPNGFTDVRGYMEQQREAILAHSSQFPNDSESYRSLELYLKIRAIDFGVRSFKGQAEGFRVLGQTHMHCLPEEI